MPRNRQSAKKAGATFERTTASYLAEQLGNPTIDRLTKTGSKDRGDIGNVRDSHGRLIAIECKNTTRQALPQWLREAENEKTNYQAHTGIVIHKRHGTANPADQYATMTLHTLTQLLTPPKP